MIKLEAVTFGPDVLLSAALGQDVTNQIRQQLTAEVDNLSLFDIEYIVWCNTIIRPTLLAHCFDAVG